MNVTTMFQRLTALNYAMFLESKHTHVLIILFYFILLLIYMYFIIGNKKYVDNEQLKTVNETNTSNYLYIYII